MKVVVGMIRIACGGAFNFVCVNPWIELILVKGFVFVIRAEIILIREKLMMNTINAKTKLDEEFP